MKKINSIVLLFVLGCAFAPVIRAEEAPATVVQPVVAVPDPDAETLREAWRAVKDTHKDLADKLAKIWDGERVGAYETLIETAMVIKVDNPDLATLLEELAKKRASESKSAR